MKKIEIMEKKLNKRITLRGVSIYLCFIFTITVLRGYGNSESIYYNYGLYLYKHRNFQASISELGRYMFLNPEEEKSLYAQLLTGIAFANLKKYEEALYYLYEVEKKAQEKGDVELLCESGFQILHVLFLSKKFSDFRIQKEKLDFLCSWSKKELSVYTHLLSVAASIYELSWEQALKEVETLFPYQPDIANSLKIDLQAVEKHKNKSPLLGGVFSLIPGLGHLYAGRPPDSLRSFLINAAFISLTVFSLGHSMYVLGAVFGVIEAIFYIANIYGGVNAVMQENARYVIEKRNSMLKKIPLPPLDIIFLREKVGL